MGGKSRQPLLDRPYLWLCFLVALLYGRTLFFSLTLLDDNVFVNDKFAFLSRWANLPELFRRESFLGQGGGVFYRPLLILTFMWDAATGGQNLAFWHLTNILLHAASTCLVFSVLARLEVKRACALLLASLFAVHPVSAQAVSWIPGRTDTVLAIWVLASFERFLAFLSGRRWRDLVLHLLFLAAALLSKELAIVVPAVFGSYAFCFKNILDRRKKAALAAGWLALLLGWVLLRKQVLHGSSAYSLGGMLQWLWTNAPAVLLFAGKMILPVGLSTYPILRDSSLWLGAATVVASAALAFRSRGTRPAVLLWSGFWSLAFLLPSLVYPDQAITPVFFEYRAYLSLVGVLVFFSELDFVRDFDLGRFEHALGGGLLILLLGALAFANSGNYRDSMACWRSAVRASPHSAFAAKQLGTVFFFRKDFERASAEYRRALALFPYEPMAHNNLGVIALSAGRLEEADREISQELSFNPSYDVAYFNLGLVRYRLGRHAEAEALWKKALELNADYTAAYHDLIVLAYQKNDLAQAARYLNVLKQRGLPPPSQRP